MKMRLDNIELWKRADQDPAVVAARARLAELERQEEEAVKDLGRALFAAVRRIRNEEEQE